MMVHQYHLKCRKCKFELIDLEVGDIVIFENTPTGSVNYSNKLEGHCITYTYVEKGSNIKYIFCKNSKNKTNKSLEGKI